MVQQSRISLSQLFALLVLSFVVLFALSEAAAWSGPTGTPPNNNVAQPINISAQDQVKQGGLGVSALAIFGDGLIQANGHLNFGTTAGNSGYGFRDNSGTMEFKDQGGAWTSFASLKGSGGTNGTNGLTPKISFGPNKIVSADPSGGYASNQPLGAQCPSGYVMVGIEGMQIHGSTENAFDSASYISDIICQQLIVSY